MRRVLLIPTVLLILMGILCFFISAGPTSAGAGGGTADPSQRPIVFCNPDDIKTLDPGRTSWASDLRVAMGLWEGLTSYHPITLAPLPGVASSWDISADKLTYTFHLRPDARWSNGDTVTAKDFLYAWKRLLEPSTGAQYGELLNCIAGVKEYAAAINDHELDATKPAPDFSSVAAAAPDPRTLVVRLVSPTAYFLDLCAFPPLFPLHEPSIRPFLLDPAHPEKGDSTAWTRPPYLVSNGPFQLTDWKLKQYLTLEPNPYYWDKKNVLCPRLIIKSIKGDERAALLAYQTGTIDVFSTIPQDLGPDLLAAQEKGQWKDAHYIPVFGTYYFQFNCARPPFNDKRVRKALDLAINRYDIVNKVTRMRQRPLGLIVPPDSIPGYKSPNALPVEGDVAQARELLKEAGYPDGKGLRTIEILYTSDAPIHGRISQAIAQMWKENLGVNTTLLGLERPGFSAAREQDHNFDVCRGGWYGDYPDPTTWLDLCGTTNGNNDGKFSNPEYDKLLSEAARETDSAKRLDILSKAESMLVNDELPFIPLYQYGDGYLYNDKKILGTDVNVRLITEFKYIHRAPIQ